MPSIDNFYLSLHLLSIHLSYFAFFSAFIAAIAYLIQDASLKSRKLHPLLMRMPDLSFLDKWNYSSIGLGFPVLTMAIISGSLWLNDTTGSFWQWNPRALYSLVLWLTYAVILHVRLSSKIRGRKVAFLSIVAFLIIIFTFFSNCNF
ncbi:MAG: hypothetical protein COV72_02455 [Candidatus Omnitrophica bacterium CG11_big_fil_rev_8_21_14_0_20_42_13]|uniref:Cytochrome c assembly protein domain-containing protein n=1 Tax=Candidatus Ghiorseimicrobium undicola TaxID=1974746 RepID=A0A2H0LYQ3_9BACT|nr:MAG: hypothetical protein COV72_02455 [Candidatus Omnitrophica bacterium CG11_big_fil_rev_8_21_14_0_20_42_13]